MKLENAAFWVLTAFFAIVAPIYWFMSGDPTGTTALALSFGLSIMIAFYLTMVSRRIPARPEDRREGEIADAAGEYGFYSPHSWNPLCVAGSGAMIFLGLVFAAWIAIIGGALMAMAVVSMCTEYYRGEHAH